MAIGLASLSCMYSIAWLLVQRKVIMFSKRFASTVLSLAAAVGFWGTSPALAAPISVDIFAYENSSSGGVAVDTGLNLVTVTVSFRP